MPQQCPQLLAIIPILAMYGNVMVIFPRTRNSQMYLQGPSRWSLVLDQVLCQHNDLGTGTEPALELAPEILGT